MLYCGGDVGPEIIFTRKFQENKRLTASRCVFARQIIQPWSLTSRDGDYKACILAPNTEEEM